MGKKVPSAELPREVSSWTPAAYQASSASDEWVLMRTAEFGKSYYWNRRTRLSSWSPQGITVVWVGTRPLLLAQGHARLYVYTPSSSS